MRIRDSKFDILFLGKPWRCGFWGTLAFRKAGIIVVQVPGLCLAFTWPVPEPADDDGERRPGAAVA